MVNNDFSLANAQFNDFLFEPIGDDARGISISMISGLARLDLDPWLESARLAALPLDGARRAIAERLGQLNVGTWDAARNLRVAERLAKLLPAPGRPARPAGAKRPMPAPVAFAAGLFVVAALAALLAISLAKTPSSGVQPSYGTIPGLNVPR